MKSRVLLIAIVASLVVLAVVTGAFSRVRGGESAAAVSGPVVGQASSVAAVEKRVADTPRQLLAAWDVRRSAAWASGEVAALRVLYTQGSAAGRADVAMLKAWRAKGLTVRDLQTQVLDFAVASSTSEKLVLDVTDRVTGGVAVGAGKDVALPADRADQRRITLVRVDGSWLVSSVR